MEIAPSNFVIEAGKIVIFKRYPPIEHHEQDNAQTPDINLRPNIRLLHQKFGGGKIDRAAVGDEEVLRGIQVCQAKVDHLHLTGLINEDIFNFQVPVTDAISVAVGCM